ncbi:hypothetical protein O181_116119 [Austropuccinia psidii MF-1]|uniref:Uncharacterized protein n=1 Tax=Austropuccinia psidii MF-1 TaxID=1389203 RepID=A0A9Q3K886_9BASI|nr:hypothetical protein [Austropuccinia psidii MF-1]
MAQEIKAISPTYSFKSQAIRCMVHTIHLAVHDDINALASNGTSTSTNTKLSKAASPMDIASLVDPPDGIYSNYNSIISQITQLASYLNQSPQRPEKFVAIVKLIYVEEKPSNAVLLLSHVVTRWNSIYEMLV